MYERCQTIFRCHFRTLITSSNETFKINFTLDKTILSFVFQFEGWCESTQISYSLFTCLSNAYKSNIVPFSCRYFTPFPGYSLNIHERKKKNVKKMLTSVSRCSRNVYKIMNYNTFSQLCMAII